jgi:hypothetical protein
MAKKRMATMIAMVLILTSSAFAMSVLGQADGAEQKAAGMIQYKLVPVPSVMTQAQLQSVLTTQGNAGYRLILPFAVGTGPIPNQTVLVFSKP